MAKLPSIAFVVLGFAFLSIEAQPTTHTSCPHGFQPAEEGCERCEDGYYSKNGEECLKCKICPRGQQKVRPCDGTMNTICKCPDGTFENQKSLICSKCSVCEPGTILTRKCLQNRDTQCERCPEGMTSNTTNSKKCFPKRDEGKKVHYHVYNNHDVKWSVIAPSIVAGLVFIFGVAFGCYTVRRKRCENKNNNLEGNEEDVLMPDLPVHFELEPAERNHRNIRELTEDINEELGKKLNINTPRNWKTLAGHLGFTREQVLLYELEPLSAVQKMLFEFSTLPNSTVFNLHSALVTMGREDAARLVEPYIYT